MPYGLETVHVQAAMQEFIDFISFVNNALRPKQLRRLECMLMSANFSSIVGEFMTVSLPKHCKTIAKNTFHNGHPDVVPKGVFHRNSILHGNAGIEVKASRYERSWQGHNPEDVFLIVFVFDSNRARDEAEKVAPKRFRFKMVVAAELAKSDWKFAGRREDSRRTITASVTKSGYDKMLANWVYMAPDMKAAIAAVSATAKRKPSRRL